ncbi:MAG: ribulose-phosphate 3-epimerase [Flavobacteriaceae bacterium]|jgi:ribulose-phosphate 3-epimerase|nr:ribulose-phosphate 3-epimerase [Flavobacteriaceae bacterium]|tara:strand:+ start:16529 stop:17197 length:669 start_codon:yes stop_codon:yes gene_type:complete
MSKQSNIIAPSILSANFASLGKEVEEVIAAGAEWVHFDVMDNHFVPNLTIGPMVCKSLIDYGITNPIDVHLMVEPVDDLIKMFADSGASSITFHPEASKDVENSLQLIEDLGCKPGLVINPDISLEVLDPYISNLYMVLLMSVFPGFGGQEYIPEVTKKISSLRKKIDCLAKDIRLEIDGGVKEDNISEISAAGADTFVAGSAIFNKPDYKDAIENLKNNLS